MINSQITILDQTEIYLNTVPVYEKRKECFLKEVNQNSPVREQFITYLHSAEHEGKLSVKMFRDDTKTVSSVILLLQKIFNMITLTTVKNRAFSARYRFL